LQEAVQVTGTFRPFRACSATGGKGRSGRRLACVAVLVALPLTACAAGYQAETSRERTTLTSVAAAKGDLSLRNIFFIGPASSGDNLPLYLAIFNGGTSTDTLLSLSSSAASGGYVPGDNTIVAGGSRYYNAGDADVPRLTGLKRDVLVGQTVTVTLTFKTAGEVKVTVPILDARLGSDRSPLPAPSPIPSASTTGQPSGSASGSASASESASASSSASATATP
jgi:copper(I)-binding protein